MSDKILLVDDDTNLLAGSRRTLRGLFDIETAEGGEKGLEILAEKGPFAVILADMRMPGMDGVQFLSKARELAPDSVRMMLTGNADQETAINAVNEGRIFRFLSKPCPKKVLISAIEAAVQQYQLITAERQLLEETLNGSVKILVDILSIIKPKAFGRASRVRRYVSHITEQLSLLKPWQLEIAAMLSQLGCVSLEDDVLDKFFAGQDLSSEEQEGMDSHPQAAGKLLINIPRLKEVSQIIERQTTSCPWGQSEADTPLTDRDEVAVGGQILKVALDFDRLLSHGIPPDLAINMLQQDKTSYDSDIVDALATMDISLPEYSHWAVEIKDLATDMILEQDVIATSGKLLVTRGQEVTTAIMDHLLHWNKNAGVQQPIRVAVPNYQTQQDAMPQKSVA